MSDDAEQVWLIPGDYADMAPLPALRRGDEVFPYNRSSKSFWEEPNPLIGDFNDAYPTFEECRAAMVLDRVKVLDMHRQICRDHAAAIEHIKTIPTQQFPAHVLREVREAQQGQQGQAQGQAEGQEQAAKEVKPPRRPAGRGNG
jgi:hypothetical protein